MSRSERKACIGLLGLQHEAVNNGSVWVFDLGYLLHGQPSVIDKSSQVIIVRYCGQTIGLLVDALHDVPAFNQSQIMHSPFTGQADGTLVKHFIKANGGQLLIQTVDVSSLFAALMNRKAMA